MRSKLACCLFVGLLLCSILIACQKTEELVMAPTVQPAEKQLASQDVEVKPLPPTPPLRETFEGQPQLSLFPRLGDYRPENDDEERLPYWHTYLEHLRKTSGVVRTDSDGVNQVFSFRGIKGVDSVGFFSPVAVKPNTSYQVSFDIKVELPAGSSTGIGIIEFDQFLWRTEQYPQSIDGQHRTGTHAGVRLSSSNNDTEQRFTFTTGPETGMIHLILFREGQADREPVLLDNLAIEKLE